MFLHVLTVMQHEPHVITSEADSLERRGSDILPPMPQHPSVAFGPLVGLVSTSITLPPQSELICVVPMEVLSTEHGQIRGFLGCVEPRSLKKEGKVRAL